jgi:metal-sulfur cluster biosynthetic enzyme
MIADDAIRAQVIGALDRVIDPCRVGRHVPAGVHEMGMVETLTLEPVGDERYDVRLTLQLTSPACHFHQWFEERVAAELTDVAAVREVQLTWSRSFDWSDDKMSPALRQRFRAKRDAMRTARTLAGAVADG